MTDDQWREWTREHRACYEVRPLQEMQGPEIAHVGFEFELVAQMPGAEEGPESRRQATTAILKTLTELAKHVFPDEAGLARFELMPFRPVAQLRPQTGFHPEVRRGVKVYYKNDSSKRVEEGVRQRLGQFEQRLMELGVKAGSWGGQP